MSILFLHLAAACLIVAHYHFHHFEHFSKQWEQRRRGSEKKAIQLHKKRAIHFVQAGTLFILIGCLYYIFTGS